MATIKQIIERVNELRPNAFSDTVKVAWISELEGKIAADVMLMSIGDIRQLEYNLPEALDAEPLVTYPHQELYVYWLQAQIDYAHGEYKKYQNSMEMYNEHYGNFVRWFANTYEPAQGYPERAWTQGYEDPPFYITAYALAVKGGFEGTMEEWLASLKGDPGVPGEPGGKGDPGKSAYEYAVEGGYEGTEEDFARKLGSEMDVAQGFENFNKHIINANNPHGVTAEQVGARPDTWMPTAEQVGARPDTWMPTAEQVGARPDTWMPTAEQVGARTNTWMPTAEQVGARPDTWSPQFFQDPGVAGYRCGLRYSGEMENPLYLAAWEFDDSANGQQPNRVVRGIGAEAARNLIGAFPVSGGTITGNTTIAKSSDPYLYFRNEGGGNNLFGIHWYGSEDGKNTLGFYDLKNKRHLMTIHQDTGKIGLFSPLAISSGGTNATDAAGARANLGAFGFVGFITDRGNDYNQCSDYGYYLINSLDSTNGPESGFGILLTYNEIYASQIVLMRNGAAWFRCSTSFAEMKTKSWTKMSGASPLNSYPVNSIYISYSHTSPASLFGGTWTRMEQTFLFGATANSDIGYTGGSYNETLTVAQLPNLHGSLQFRAISGGANNASVKDKGNVFTYTENGGDTWNSATGKVEGNQATDLITFNVGEGASHNNMPPYTEVSIWRRIA